MVIGKAPRFEKALISKVLKLDENPQKYDCASAAIGNWMD